MHVFFLAAPLTAVGVGVVRWLAGFGRIRKRSWTIGMVLTVLGFLAMDVLLLTGSPERSVGPLPAITLYALSGALAVGGALLASGTPDTDDQKL